MKLVYDINQKPPLKKNLVYAFQQLLAIMAATLLVPVLAYFIIFHYAPMYGVQIAFRRYSIRKGILGSQWVGMAHFNRFFQSYYFERLLVNTLTISLYNLALGFPLPILLALLLNEVTSKRYKKFVQNVTYAPHFISTVVLCGMVIAFTAPDTGIINSLVVLLGGKSVDYMTQESSWRAIYVISDIWKNTGWSSIIYLAALAGIDPQLHESAQIDGASRLQRVWHINLPGIRQTIILLFILWGLWKKINVYDAFIEGAKEGFTTAIRIIPYLVAFLVGIAVFRTSGAMDILVNGIGYVVGLFGVDTSFVGALPTALMKSLSGSGANGLMIDTMKEFGPDSFVSRVSCVVRGASDTTFYILAVYFGSVGITKTRNAVTCGLIADFSGIIAAILISYLFFF